MKTAKFGKMKRRDLFTAFFSLITIPVIGKLLPKETEYVDCWTQKYNGSLALSPRPGQGGIHFLIYNGDSTWRELEEWEQLPHSFYNTKIVKDVDIDFIKTQ